MSTPKFDTPSDWKSPAWWRNRSLDERLFHCRIPKRLSSTEAMVERDEGDRSCVWAYNFTLGDSLLISGKSKTGKTQLAISILKTILYDPDVSLSARFLDTDDYIEMIKDSFDSKDGQLPEMYSNPHLIKMVKGSFDLLILDGLGQERQTEFARHELGTLLRHRYDHELSTIITSTLSLMEIREAYGDRVSSLISDMEQITCKATT